MNNKTRILIVEHDPIDLELLQYELKRSDIEYESQVVIDGDSYGAALKDFNPDIILSDYTLPAFDGPTAFKLREEISPTTPFIFVSGSIGEENSVEYIKNGVTDYVLKDKMFTLITKIKRALNESKEKHEKIRIEQERIQSERKLARAQKVAQMGSWELDFATNTLMLSDEACRIFGFPLSERNLSFDAWTNLVHPEDIDFILKQISDSQEHLNDTAFYHRIIRSDKLVKHVYSESKFELDDTGAAIGLYGIVQDVTEKKIAEEKARFEKNNLNALINNTNDLMWSVDRKFNLITSNDAFVEKIKELSNTIIKKGDSLLMPQYTVQQLSAYKACCERAFAGEAFTEVEYDKSPVEYWREVSYYPIRLGDKVIGTACHAHDITASKRAEKKINELNENLEKRITERTAELVDANKALETFSYSVSHDLRSPVRTIIGFASIINRQYSNNLGREVKELFTHIEGSGLRMNTIIDDLLTLAKSGKDKLDPAEVDLTALIKKVWADISFAAPNKAKLEIEQIPIVCADSSMMQQVVVNLLSNAIKYSSKTSQPLIQVGFTQNDMGVTVFVKDNGAGFDMKFYDRLFEAFHRLHGVSEFEGTGIGLTLIKKIIERHGGKVWAEAAVNKGATFYFTLPFASTDVVGTNPGIINLSTDNIVSFQPLKRVN